MNQFTTTPSDIYMKKSAKLFTQMYLQNKEELEDVIPQVKLVIDLAIYTFLTFMHNRLLNGTIITTNGNYLVYFLLSSLICHSLAIVKYIKNIFIRQNF